MFSMGMLAALSALAGFAGYQYSKGKHKNNNASAPATTNTGSGANNGMTKAQTVYNYNYLNDSNTGNTLFNSQQKTKRTLFGNERV